MKKNLGLFILAWLLLFALFNIITFLVPAMPFNDKYTDGFWLGYAFIAIFLMLHIISVAITFKDESSKATLYNIPLLRKSYLGLIMSFVVGSICMIFSSIPYWLGVVICAIILVLHILSILKTRVAINEVERIDSKVKTQTFFVKSLTVDAETLMASAKDETIKAECRKVVEAIRYSDPMSSEALASLEGAIMIKYANLQNAVQANDKEQSLALADELVILINDRNKKCKLLK